MKRHPFDLLSFLFGAIFVAVAAAALLGIDLLDLQDVAWVIPTLLVILGAALLAGAAGRRTDPDTAEIGTDHQLAVDDERHAAFGSSDDPDEQPRFGDAGGDEPATSDVGSHGSHLVSTAPDTSSERPDPSRADVPLQTATEEESDEAPERTDPGS